MTTDIYRERLASECKFEGKNGLFFFSIVRASPPNASLKAKFVSICVYLVCHCPLGARVIQDHLMNVHGRDGLGTALVLNVGNSEKEGEKNTFSKVSALVYVLCKPTRREFFF